MRHRIPLEGLGPNADVMSDAVTACVHCGFCLPSCPTYQVLGEEMDSPRGRIYLMKGVLEGDLDAAGVQPHIDRCLGCMACETACPSGVRYHELLLPYRSLMRAESSAPGASRSGARASDTTSLTDRLRQWITMRTLPFPARFRAAVRLGRLARPFGALAPRALRPLLELVPASLPTPVTLPSLVPARGPKRARVALLTGCVQSVLEPDINTATVDVLARNGVEVVIPPAQGCCGALAWHVGAAEEARAFARDNVRAFPAGLDAIVVNAAGCASAMREYPLVFRGEPDEEAARTFAAKVVDVSVFLDRLGPIAPPPAERAVRIAMHDPCHLCHAQQVRDEPRRLLAGIDGVELIALDDGERCCGSAGSYNIEQPAIAAELGRRKADAVRRTDCDVVASGNVGCTVQIRRYLGDIPPVLHPMQILAAAHAGRLAERIARAHKPLSNRPS